MPVTNATIRAVNELTARWARASDPVAGDGTVFSAVGVWPLLAFLADGADGPARTELADAVGLPAAGAAGAARELLGAMGTMRGLDSALGLWTKRTLQLRERWEAGLPAEAHGVLTGDPAADKGALDAWAAKRTGGLIGEMPVALETDTEMVLASALAMRTNWLRRFWDFPMTPETGPWADRRLVGLYRQSELLDRVGVADTPEGHVTELRVLGDNAIDVHLLLGEEGMTRGQVLRAGVDVLARRLPVVSGPQLPYGEVGPGLRVVKKRSERPLPPTLDVTTAAFDLRAHHDLLALHRVFGLTTARDVGRGHFPGISGFPLAVGSARQSTTAQFGAVGFRAAAVTAFGFPAGGVPQLRWVTTSVRAAFDRPFGFLALHRHTRLVLAAGWVTDPEPYREDEEHY
ncbi:serpin family protein [Streptomyces chartreusis]|uniref:Proteinase inhibitor I4 serpin n=1 Tax=Streptomyces chartreusis TaxID=1969 RepID=A0A7H8T6T4_STRCX|nr:serpin family protein [Streptomyces chartreusis]QKZ19044.1 proteinase inhibitor I4 serpin [Streptomyces chartreusis]